MICPYCRAEMEPGYLMAGNSLNWNPKEQLINLPDRENGGFRLAWNWGAVSVPSNYCPACNVIILRPKVPREERNKKLTNIFKKEM